MYFYGIQMEDVKEKIIMLKFMNPAQGLLNFGGGYMCKNQITS